MAPSSTFQSVSSPGDEEPPKTFPNPIHPTFLDRLDQDFVDYYNKHLAVKPATHGVAIADIRANPTKYLSPWCQDFSGEPFVEERKIPSDDGHVFTARCYLPDASTSPFGAGPYPAYVNFHGGGFAHGDLTSDTELCLLIRNRLGVMVIDVEYRLCPENPFGKGHDDAWAAVRWIHSHASDLNVKADSISIGGISAGATISAVVQQLARDAGLHLKLAILAVPTTAYHGHVEKPTDSPYASFAENELAPCLNMKRILYFASLYHPKTEAALSALDARPAFFKNPILGNMAGVCDTFIATASCDPLRDEGEQYGQRLIEAGVRTTVRRYTGVPHPFMHMSPLKKAQMYVDDICGELKRVHGP